MSHYYAVIKEDGFQLIPISKDAVYAVGYFVPENGVLRIQSSLTYQDFQWVGKVDDFGNAVIKAVPIPNSKQKEMKQVIERRTVLHNYTFDLKGEDAGFFIREFVMNKDTALEIFNARSVPEVAPQPESLETTTI